MDEIAKIDKSLASVCKGDDKKSDAMMLMSPDSNWDQFLTPAPFAICLLGDLILISADTDFSLNEKPPKDGFKLIRYPNSFRASLVQLSNAGWDAFNEAHTSMDQIYLHSGNVDGHVKNAVKFLIHGTTEEVKKMLPLSLSKIKDIADESLLLAQNIENRFVTVMELTGELLEACTNTKGVYDKKNKETEIAIEVARTERRSLRKEEKETDKRLSKMNKEVKEAQSDFKEAMDAMPSGGDLIGVAVCEALVEGVRNASSFPCTLKGVIKKTLDKLDTDEGGVTDYDIEVSRHKVYSQVSVMVKYVYQIAEITTGNTDANGQPCPIMGRVGELDRFQKLIETHRDRINSEIYSGGLRERVLKLCDDAAEICISLQCLVKSMADLENKDAIILNAVKKTKNLQDEFKILEVEAGKVIGRNPLDIKSPHLSKMPTQSGSSSMIQASTENARYKTELAKETLRDAKRRQEKSADELRDTNVKLRKVMKDMAKLDLTKINFNTIRETLVRGIKALAEVREQWGKLVRFFQIMSNLIKCCLHSSLTDFVDQATMGRELKMGNHAVPLSNIFRDVIFEQASKASQVAHVVRAIAGTYVQVSNEHLMDRITRLGRLVALDPKKDGEELELKHKELHKGCEDAQKAILSIIMKQKEEFNAKVEERIAKLHEIEKAMPSIEPERIIEIQRNVASGMAAFTDEDVDDLV